MIEVQLQNENAILRHDLEVCEVWIDTLEADNQQLREHYAALHGTLGALWAALTVMGRCVACRSCREMASDWAERLASCLAERTRMAGA